MSLLLDVGTARAYKDHYVGFVAAAADFIKRNLWTDTPSFGIVLGSGLNDLVDQFEEPKTIIPYADIPHFPTPTVLGHVGNMHIGSIQGVPVIGLQGRTHYYEVADHPFNVGMLQVVFPVHVLATLGVKNYFATNAAGGLNSSYHVGDIMIITSHNGQLLPNPLAGQFQPFTTLEGKTVERFQPMNGAYDPELRSLLSTSGEAFADHVHEGTYIAVPGPTYETEAECKAFRDGWKGDAVGMSTAPEVIVARNRGMKAVGFSCITNVIGPDGTNATSHEEVQAVLTSSTTRDRLSTIVRTFFSLYKQRKP